MVRSGKTEAREELEAAQARREQMREAIQGISEAYHPYDPANAQAVQAVEVERRLEARFARIDRLAEDAGLSDGGRARIEKARRLIKSIVATIAFFHLQERLWVSELALAPEAEQVVMNELIPSLYSQRMARKLPAAEQRAKVVAISEPILARLRDPAGVNDPVPALKGAMDNWPCATTGCIG